MRWEQKELPKTNFQKVHQEKEDEKICLIFHKQYMPSVVLHIRQERGVILYKLKLFKHDILNIHIA